MHPKMHSMQQKHLFLFKNKQSSEMCLSLAPYELKGVSMPKIQDGVTKWKYKKSPGCYYLCHAITIVLHRQHKWRVCVQWSLQGQQNLTSLRNWLMLVKTLIPHFSTHLQYSPSFWVTLIYLGIGESPVAPTVCKELTWDRNAWRYAQGAWTSSREM